MINANVRSLAAALLVPVLLLAGCSDDGTSAPSETTNAPIDGTQPDQQPSDDPSEGVRSIEIEVGEFTFDALEAGPADGDLVLLLHGFPQTADQWRSQIEALSKAGYHVVAPNQRGYSPGARPVEVEEYTRDRLAEDVIGMADALGHDRFHLVGHDWGGAVSWEVAARYPERLGSVTVVSTPHDGAMRAMLTNPENDQRERSSYIFTLAQEGSEDLFLADDAALLRSLYRDAGLSVEEMQRQLSVLTDPDTMRAALHWYRAAILGGAPTGPSTIPTMYVWSDGDDALGPDAAAATADYVTGPYRFEVLKGVNHWIPERAADELNELLLDFLSDEDPL